MTEAQKNAVAAEKNIIRILKEQIDTIVEGGDFSVVFKWWAVPAGSVGRVKKIIASYLSENGYQYYLKSEDPSEEHVELIYYIEWL